MVVFDASYWLAPGVNIHRDPLQGCGFEYYSEDPFLAGTIAAALGKGVQAVGGVTVTYKHFFGNSQESSRSYVSSFMTERAAREIYLRNFEIALKESKARAVMTSYNHVNGEHPNQNPDLILGILRGEWGFDGIVMFDWGAYGDGEQLIPSGISYVFEIGSNPGRVIQIENACYANRQAAIERVKESLTELMRVRVFTEANSLPVYYYPEGPLTQTVSKTSVGAAQTAGITAPITLGGAGNLSYTVSLGNISIGSNYINVSAQFDAAKLAFVDSKIEIPGASFLNQSFDTDTGMYTATIALLQQGALFQASASTPILTLNFAATVATGEIVASLSSVSLHEVVSPTSSPLFNCALDPSTAITVFGAYDIDGDGKTTTADISLIIFNYYLVKAGDAKWDDAHLFDVNNDGIIDLVDIMIVSTFI